MDLSVLICLCVLPPFTWALVFERDRYHSHDEIRSGLTKINKQYPHITQLRTLQPQKNNLKLFVMVIGHDVANLPHLTPHVKYVGNMHGDEIVNRELLLFFIEYLVTEYGTNREVTRLLESTIIHILPSMNPEGARRTLKHRPPDCRGSNGGRTNDNYIDLNRDFPTSLNQDTKTRSRETRAIIRWMNERHFVLSANFHGGELVANYPWDHYEQGTSHTTDDDVFVHLAKSYANNHATMSRSSRFPGGITNGAAWYAISGGMQDYNYLRGTMELTIEAHRCKYDTGSTLASYWNANRNALLQYVKAVHLGVKGHVYDFNKNPVKGALVQVKGREGFKVKSDQHGSYWRILTHPGVYTLKVSAQGHPNKEVEVIIVANDVIIRDIFLDTAK